MSRERRCWALVLSCCVQNRAISFGNLRTTFEAMTVGVDAAPVAMLVADDVVVAVVDVLDEEMCKFVVLRALSRTRNCAGNCVN